MADVKRLFSVGLPVGCMLLFLGIAIANPEYYRSHVRRHETGWQEQATVLSLAPAVLLGVGIWLRRRALPVRWLHVWVILLTAGALYYGGEECSWGQNYFGWSTPETWSAINEQQETNLHNTSGLFDQAPRALLTLAAAASLVIPFVRRQRQLERDPRTSPVPWLLPTTAVVPAAALAILAGIPQKFYGHYDKTNVARDWFSEMFLAGRHSEMKECFLAMFILMYVWSFAVRLKDVSSTSAGSVPVGRATREGREETRTGRAAA
jgi:hypothetical protein